MRAVYLVSSEYSKQGGDGGSGGGTSGKEGGTRLEGELGLNVQRVAVFVQTADGPVADCGGAISVGCGISGLDHAPSKEVLVASTPGIGGSAEAALAVEVETAKVLFVLASGPACDDVDLSRASSVDGRCDISVYTGVGSPDAVVGTVVEEDEAVLLVGLPGKALPLVRAIGVGVLGGDKSPAVVVVEV